MLKIPHNLERGHRETKLNWNWKLYSCSLAFILLKGSLQTSGEEKRTITSSCKPYALQYWRAWYDVFIGGNSGMHVLWVTNHFQIGFQTHSTGGNTCCHCRIGQKPMARKTTEALWVIYIIKILTNGQMVYEYLCLFSQSIKAFILGQMQTLEHMLDSWPVTPFHTNTEEIVSTWVLMLASRMLLWYKRHSVLSFIFVSMNLQPWYCLKHKHHVIGTSFSFLFRLLSSWNTPGLVYPFPSMLTVQMNWIMTTKVLGLA